MTEHGQQNDVERYGGSQIDPELELHVVQGNGCFVDDFLARHVIFGSRVKVQDDVQEKHNVADAVNDVDAGIFNGLLARYKCNLVGYLNAVVHCDNHDEYVPLLASRMTRLHNALIFELLDCLLFSLYSLHLRQFMESLHHAFL